MTQCLFCNRKNAAGALECAQCRAQLPRSDFPEGLPEERFPSIRGDDVTWHPEMATLVLQGRDADALRLYRERTGGRMGEARQALAALRQGQAMSIRKSGVSEGTSQEADLLNLLRAGKAGQAVTLYRTSTGSNERDAVESIERLAARHNIVRPSAGCLPLLSLLLFLLIVAEWQFVG